MKCVLLTHVTLTPSKSPRRQDLHADPSPARSSAGGGSPSLLHLPGRCPPPAPGQASQPASTSSTGNHCFTQQPNQTLHKWGLSDSSRDSQRSIPLRVYLMVPLFATTSRRDTYQQLLLLSLCALGKDSHVQFPGKGLCRQGSLGKS